MRKPFERELREGRRENSKVAVEKLEVVVIHGDASMASSRSSRTRRRHRWKRIHVDIQLPDLSPSFLRIGPGAEAHCGGEVEDRSRVNWKEGERIQMW